MTNEINLAEAADAFTYTLGYPVHVEIVDALTQVYKDYKKASGSTTQRQVKAPQRPQEPMVDVHTTSGVQPTQMDLTNDEQSSKPDSAAVDAAKAAALAFLAKKTGGAAISATTGADIPVHSFDDVPVVEMEESYVSSLDDIPPHPLIVSLLSVKMGEVFRTPYG